MADTANSHIANSRNRNDPFRSWDAFERLFDEALSRSKSRPLSPDLPSPLSASFSEDSIYANAGATPYASGSPAFESSNESLSFSVPEKPPVHGDAFDRFWDEGLRRTRRSTVTPSRPAKWPKRELDSSGSNSTSSSNDTSNSPTFASPQSPVSPSSPPRPAPSLSPRPLQSAISQKLRKRKSKVNFQDSADGKTVTATFEIPGVQKSDVHVSYQTDKVVISWESVTVDEKMEGDRLIRDRKENRYVRTLPLPEGTKFEEIKASMDGRRLLLIYPKFAVRRPSQVIEIKTE